MLKKSAATPPRNKGRMIGLPLAASASACNCHLRNCPLAFHFVHHFTLLESRGIFTSHTRLFENPAFQKISFPSVFHWLKN